jgi:hypothetical protein
MRLTVDNVVYKYKFDKELTIEVICYLFALNYKQTGLTYLSEQDLFTLLFLIDVISLEQTYCLVTGDEYIIGSMTNHPNVIPKYTLFILCRNDVISLTASDKYDYNSNKSVFYNPYQILTCNNIKAITNVVFDHLSEYLEGLITKVYTEHMLHNSYNNLLHKLLIEDVQSCPYYTLYNIKSPVQYVSLDYLIDVLSLDKEAVTESLALHNVSR